MRWELLDVLVENYPLVASGLAGDVQVVQFLL
jgi:hypothetical protein